MVTFARLPHRAAVRFSWARCTVISLSIMASSPRARAFNNSSRGSSDGALARGGARGVAFLAGGIGRPKKDGLGVSAIFDLCKGVFSGSIVSRDGGDREMSLRGLLA